RPRQARRGGRPRSRRRARAPRGGPPVIAPVRWEGDALVLLDQTRLPREETFREHRRWEDVADAIRTLVVRGAPAIGVAAAFGLVLAARQSAAATFDALLAD